MNVNICSFKKCQSKPVNLKHGTIGCMLEKISRSKEEQKKVIKKAERGY